MSEPVKGPLSKVIHRKTIPESSTQRSKDILKTFNEKIKEPVKGPVADGMSREKVSQPFGCVSENSKNS